MIPCLNSCSKTCCEHASTNPYQHFPGLCWTNSMASKTPVSVPAGFPMSSPTSHGAAIPDLWRKHHKSAFASTRPTAGLKGFRTCLASCKILIFVELDDMLMHLDLNQARFCRLLPGHQSSADERKIATSCTWRVVVAFSHRASRKSAARPYCSAFKTFSMRCWEQPIGFESTSCPYEKTDVFLHSFWLCDRVGRGPKWVRMGMLCIQSLETCFVIFAPGMDPNRI